MSVEDFYNSYWADESGFKGREHAQLDALLSSIVDSDSDCLDFGCGDGLTVTRYLTSVARSCVGVDVSSVAVQAARDLGLDAREIDDATALPFADRSFDLVTCIEVLEHLFQPEATVAELTRVTRPGGHLYFQVPNVVHWRHRYDFAIRGRFIPLGDDLSLEQPWRDPHIRFFTPHTLPAMLDKVGLEVVSVDGNSRNVAAGIPVLRRFVRDGGAGPISRRLTDRLPSVFGERIQCIARKPDLGGH
jgi:methionine biosynthesis protein MetW